MPNMFEVADQNVGGMKAYKDRAEIIKEFANTINKYSLENDSHTPDFIIAEYLFNCLVNFQLHISKRSIWYNPGGKS